jgi:dienelactone hydrolase
MYFTSESSSNRVVERHFTVDDITGVIWTPETDSAGAPLILCGHSGGMHKQAPGLVAHAQHLVTRHGYSVVAIDAPGHGGRPRNEQDQQWVDALRAARAKGPRLMGPIIAEYNSSLAERAVPEWQATLDALQALPEIGTERPVGYGGTTLGTVVGLKLVAAEPRIAAAAFGPVIVFDALLEWAKQITIPVDFQVAWEDPEIDPRPSLKLFDACASRDKALHVYPGEHRETPRLAADGTDRFLTKHLRTAA